MNYDEMSDFEINMAVADAIGLFWHSRPNKNKEGKWLYSENYHLCDTKLHPAVDLPDYCNNPSDAWSIIIESKINIDFRESISAGPMCRVSGNSEVYHVDKNPLRAAMIVFLKIKEGE
jgi:hypothetical protein